MTPNQKAMCNETLTLCIELNQETECEAVFSYTNVFDGFFVSVKRPNERKNLVFAPVDFNDEIFSEEEIKEDYESLKSLLLNVLKNENPSYYEKR